MSGRVCVKDPESARYRWALCVGDSSASSMEMVMYEVYSVYEVSPTVFPGWYHFVILVSVWGMSLLRQNLLLILPCPDQ